MSELNTQVSTLLETGLAELWIEGEVTNLFVSNSGHAYFALKDDQSQVKCVLFKQRQSLLNTSIKNGDQIIVRATASLFQSRGDFQLLVQYVEDAGEGRLRKAFEQLKQKLSSEGLFDRDIKKPLPEPDHLNTIAVITSPQGAVIHDIIATLKRRCPLLRIIVFSTPVQGIDAAPTISNQITIANRLQECDVIILTRGGGSLEDLAAFNDEHLARTIANSTTPVISAIGHETDFTICDLVADLRAATPTAAAEMVAPDIQQSISKLGFLNTQLRKLATTSLTTSSQSFDYFQYRLRSPVRRLSELTGRVEHYKTILISSISNIFIDQQRRLYDLRIRHSQLHPNNIVFDYSKVVGDYRHKLINSSEACLGVKQVLLNQAAQSLNIVNPLATLNRGYAIVTKIGSAKIIKNYKLIKSGDRLSIRLSDGKVICKVV